MISSCTSESDKKKIIIFFRYLPPFYREKKNHPFLAIFAKWEELKKKLSLILNLLLQYFIIKLE